MGAFVGRDVVVELAIADEAIKPAASTYKVLGMVRDKSISASWDTADTTADSSPDCKEQMRQFKVWRQLFN